MKQCCEQMRDITLKLLKKAELPEDQQLAGLVSGKHDSIRPIIISTYNEL